jgi:hypothetical protein
MRIFLDNAHMKRRVNLTIDSKLLARARDSRSEMQLRDVRNLLSTDCDMDYLRSRAKTLAVDKLMEEVLAGNE